jgi:hypothetical protein
VSIERGRTDEQNPTYPAVGVMGLWCSGVLGRVNTHFNGYVGMWGSAYLAGQNPRSPECHNPNRKHLGFWWGWWNARGCAAWTRLSNQRRRDATSASVWAICGGWHSGFCAVHRRLPTLNDFHNTCSREKIRGLPEPSSLVSMKRSVPFAPKQGRTALAEEF